MKIDVPLIVNEKNDCGPVAVKMILDYFRDEIPLSVIERLCIPEKGGACWTISLAMSAGMFGYSVDFYSEDLGDNNFDLDYYKKEMDSKEEAEKKLGWFRTVCKYQGVGVEKKSLELGEILERINKDCLGIVLLDWHVVMDKKEKGFQGHIVPIVGYDEENVYINQSGPIDPEKDFPIKRELFDKARKAKGTDEDILFISKREE